MMDSRITPDLLTQDLCFLQSSPNVFYMKSDGKRDAKCFGGKDNSCVKAIFPREKKNNALCLPHGRKESNSI